MSASSCSAESRLASGPRPCAWHYQVKGRAVMPSVKVWGITSQFAADDLPVVVSFFACCHVVLLAICIAVLFGFNKDESEIPDGFHGYIPAYSAIMMAICVASLVLEVSIVRQSRRGTISTRCV